jgi:esterase/lipase superfamily enzyme
MLAKSPHAKFSRRAERPVLDGFGKVGIGDVFFPFQVGRVISYYAMRTVDALKGLWPPLK